MAFFERFRVELGRYADGVHELGDPVPAAELAARALPEQLVDFYRSWDGARLFTDTATIVRLRDAAALPDGALRLGEWPEGALELDAGGRVRSRDDDGAVIVVGSTLERFLAAFMAREGLLVDREGEFKDVFDEESVEDKVREKQTRAALKADPDAAAWHLEAAERAFGDGDEAAAEAALARAVALDEGAAAAWALLA
ncbi:MAG: Tetratricopeptide 4, partial [Myxococcales bacterium]|nr:Tetratricopeptide 4 [Myxococcales bacterium]